MKYDQAWLKRVNATKQLIPKVRELIASVPQIQDRNTLKTTLNAVVDDFEHTLECGGDTMSVGRSPTCIAWLMNW